MKKRLFPYSAAALLCGAAPGEAQLPLSPRASVQVPSLALTATGRSTRPITAAEAAAQTAATAVEVYTKSVSFRSAHYPIDSIRTAIVQSGAQWLARLQTGPIMGIQLDPSGRVGVAANQDGYAQQQIATRLATPGLALSDKAFTLYTAVDAFSDRYTPERLSIAERYLAQLDVLGDTAALWQFEARKTLLWTYYLLGRSTDVVRLGTAAIALLDRIPFADRYLPMFAQVAERVYSPTIEALTGQPNARGAVTQLNAALWAAATPSSILVAGDSGYAYLGESYRQSAQEWIEGNAKLGTLAAPLVAHYWLNRASHDSATIPVNDGKIRLIEVAHTGCLPCVHELHALQRMLDRYPHIEPILVTWTFGSWGNRLVEPAEEVQHLTEYFVTNTKVTFPVGIWAGKKTRNADDGVTPEDSPNLKNYPLFGKPMLWVVDGHGIIRRVFTGYDREIESQIVRTVDFLVREAALVGMVPHPAPSVSARP